MITLQNKLTCMPYESKQEEAITKHISTLQNAPTKLQWMIEISVLRHFMHANIPKLLAVMFRKETCDIITEKYTCLEEFDVTTINNDLRINILMDIGAALVYLHSHGLLHSNVDRKNIMLEVENNNVNKAVLCGFGSIMATSYRKLKRPVIEYGLYELKLPDPMTYIPDTRCISRFATNSGAYSVCSRPPEVIHNSCISTLSETWAFGCLCLSLCAPIEGIDMTSADEKSGMCQTAIDGIINKYTQVNDNVKAICDHSLRIDPYERASIANLIGFPVQSSSSPSPSPIPELEGDTPHDIYDSIYSDQPYHTLIKFVNGMSGAVYASSHISCMIEKWQTQSDISEDCVLYCIHLISAITENKEIQEHFKNNAYIPICICLNIGIQLFHPNINILLQDIYYKSAATAHISNASLYINDLFWIFRNVFDCNVFKFM